MLTVAEEDISDRRTTEDPAAPIVPQIIPSCADGKGIRDNLRNPGQNRHYVRRVSGTGCVQLERMTDCCANRQIKIGPTCSRIAYFFATCSEVRAETAQANPKKLTVTHVVA